MTQQETLHCSLSGEELMQRIAEWKELGAHALTRENRGNQVVTTFPRREEVSTRLRELIAAEAECCTFMKFDVEERQDEIVVELRVPDEMAPMLSMMLGAVGAEQA